MKPQESARRKRRGSLGSGGRNLGTDEGEESHVPMGSVKGASVSRLELVSVWFTLQLNAGRLNLGVSDLESCR